MGRSRVTVAALATSTDTCGEPLGIGEPQTSQTGAGFEKNPHQWHATRTSLD
jgi:hypothetical protein